MKIKKTPTFFLLFLCFFLYITPTFTQTYDVEWTDFINTSANGNTLTKIAGGNNWCNGAALSTNTIPANTDGWMEYTVAEKINLMVGLSTYNTSACYSSIQFAAHINGSRFYVYESGSNKYSNSNFSVGDILRVERVGSTIRYKKNGVVFYTSATASTGELIGDASIYQQGKSVHGGKMSHPAPSQVDNTPPTAPGNLTASNITQTSAQLDWTASTDNVGVTGYDVYKDGAFLATIPNTTYVVPNLAPSSSYTFYVKAKDASDNKSANSNSVNVTTLSPTGLGEWIEGTNLLYTYNNVGINTATPSSNLEINAGGSAQRAFSISNGGSRNFQIMGDGTTYSREVFVNMTNFPDYVFASDYDLMPLSKVEAYILENKHLPGIPSAKEMEEKPLGLAELNKLYLEKIEELTLHVIELNKKVEQIEKKDRLTERKGEE